MSKFYKDDVEKEKKEKDDEEAGQCSSSSVVSVITQQPTAERLPLPAHFFEHVEKSYYYSMEIGYNLHTTLVIVEYDGSSEKSPLCCSNHDVIEYNTPEELAVKDAAVVEDFGEPPPERDPPYTLDDFDVIFYAGLVKKRMKEELTLFHKSIEQIKNCVISYSGDYRSDLEESILREIGALNFFKHINCLPISHMYHEIFHMGRSTPDCQNEAPIVLYAGSETSWLFARHDEPIFLSEETGTNLASAHHIVMTALHTYFQYANRTDFGMHQNNLLVLFESVTLNHFGISDMRDVWEAAKKNRKRTANLISVMDPINCFVTKKAYIAVRTGLNAVLKKHFRVRDFEMGGAERVAVDLLGVNLSLSALPEVSGSEKWAFSHRKRSRSADDVELSIANP